MTVLGCLGHLWSTVVYFHRVVDLDMYICEDGGRRQQN